jgi:hypothetical protein
VTVPLVPPLPWMMLICALTGLPDASRIPIRTPAIEIRMALPSFD